MTKLATIPQAIEAFKAGHMVIIVDDEDRENEGDLAIAADLMADVDRVRRKLSKR